MRLYYEDDAVQLYHGDCRELLAPEDSAASRRIVVDHVITDPPYDDETHAGARTAATAAPGQAAGILDIRFVPLGDPVWLVKLLDPLRWSIAFCAMEMLGDYRKAAGEERWIRGGFWRRTTGAPQFTGDRPAQPGEGLAIWHRPGMKKWNGGGKPAFYAYPVVQGAERVHETQKPEALILNLVLDFTDVGDLILDPFAGSGTLGVAAKRAGRRAILCELKEEHCASAARRIQEASLDERIARVPGRRGKQGAMDWEATC